MLRGWALFQARSCHVPSAACQESQAQSGPNAVGQHLRDRRVDEDHRQHGNADKGDVDDAADDDGDGDAGGLGGGMMVMSTMAMMMVLTLDHRDDDVGKHGRRR